MSFFSSAYLVYLLWFLAKTPSERSKLPRPQDFSKALYTFDIGQNDLSVGFRKMNFDQLRAAMPDIVNQLATAVQVSNQITSIAWNKKFEIRDSGSYSEEKATLISSLKPNNAALCYFCFA